MIENELKQEIIKGRKVTLYGEDWKGQGVEGYNIGEEYEVDEVRIKPNYGIQVFLKGNIHPYPITSFYNPTKKLKEEARKEFENTDYFHIPDDIDIASIGQIEIEQNSYTGFIGKFKITINYVDSHGNYCKHTTYTGEEINLNK